jgi:hypothetical protein
MKAFFFLLVIVWLPIVVGAESGALAAEGQYGLVDNLKTLSSRVASQAQHEKIPTDDIWWTVNGLDMLWNFKNLHQLMPTVQVHRTGAIAGLGTRLDVRVRDFGLTIGDEQVSFKDFVYSDHSTAMGIVILHKGRVVFEEYPRMETYETPIFWSVSKLFPGLLVRILEERGELDVSLPIEVYLKRLSTSAFAGVTGRNLLDMASGLDCGDEYQLQNSCCYQYSIAIGDGFWREGALETLMSFWLTSTSSACTSRGRSFRILG